MTGNYSRLLFAAARGARIQVRCTIHQEWRPADYVQIRRFSVDDHERHIHPADDHLQYGMVSSQLREAAERPPRFLGDIDQPACTFIWEIWEDGFAGNYEYMNELHQSIFLLLLAEDLADVGL